MDRDEFNRVAASTWNNTYDAGSRQVLQQDRKIAIAQNDPRAVASIDKDLERTVGNTNSSSYGSPDPIPTNDARSSLGQLAALAPDLEAAIFGADKERSAASAEASTAARAAGQAAGESITTAGEQAVHIDEVHRQLLQAVGLDINDPSSNLSTELRREAEARRQREGIDAQMSQLEQVNFFQDPISFFQAQPQLQQLTAQYNNLARIENKSNENIARMQVLSDNVLKNTPAKAADLIRQQAAADATVAVQTATANAANLTAQNAAGHAKALMDAFTARHNIFASVLQVQQLGALEEQRQFMRQDRMDQRERQAELDKIKEDERSQETALAVGINTYRRAINGTTLPDLTSKDIKAMPTPLRTAWYNVILRGNYGNGYQESIPFINEFGNPAAAAEAGNATMMVAVKNIQTRVQNAVPEILNREKLKNPMIQIKPDQAMAMAYAETFAQDVATAQKGADKSGVKPGSPYAIDYDVSAEQAVSSKSPTVVAKTLVAAKERAGYRGLNSAYSASMLLNEVTARVVAGESTPKEAAESISRFYATQAVKTYEDSGLKYLGLPQPTDWVIRPGATGNAQVDLMNPTKVENYLTSQIARSKSMNRVGRSFLFQ